MKLINLPQGSPEWLEWRTKVFTASNAPAMMGASKYMSRMELLDFYSTGKVKPVDKGTQMIFDRGHRTEASMRPIAERQASSALNRDITFDPKVGVAEDFNFPSVEDAQFFQDRLGASFDGLSEDMSITFEHKQQNKDLFAAIESGSLPEYIIWQIEHQMLVSGAKECWFICSDGTEENMKTFHYTHEPFSQRVLLDGWRQFAIDLEEHTPAAQSEEWLAIEKELDECDKKIEYYQAIRNEAKSKAIQFSGGKIDQDTGRVIGGTKVVGVNWTLSPTTTGGTISYSKVVKDKLNGVDLEGYRSEKSQSFALRRRKK